MNKKIPPEAMVNKYVPREVITTFDGLIEALEREIEKLRTVDIYLNEAGKRRLEACEKIQFLSTFCDAAANMVDLELYDELGEDTGSVWDILVAIDRIVNLEKGAKE